MVVVACPAPQAGLAVAELILHGEYRTIDLTRMAPTRYMRREGRGPQPLLERNVI